jgi:hypothetical protein
MNTYTTEELEELANCILKDTYLRSQNFSTDSPESALLNTFGLIMNYRKKGPEKVQSKISEFSETGKLAQTGPEMHTYQKIYILLYETPIEELPLYLDTPYDIIAVWRLNLAKKITE